MVYQFAQIITGSGSTLPGFSFGGFDWIFSYGAILEIGENRNNPRLTHEKTELSNDLRGSKKNIF